MNYRFHWYMPCWSKVVTYPPGIDIRPLREIDGSVGFNEVFLTDVRVPDERRLGEVGQGPPGLARRWLIAR
jgi:alkylation response protein AidB-like acyl-CoA dehydrogenase